MLVGLVLGLIKSYLEGFVFCYVQEMLGLKLMGFYCVVWVMKFGELDKQYFYCELIDLVLEVEQVIYLEDGMLLEYVYCYYCYDYGGIILVNNGQVGVFVGGCVQWGYGVVGFGSLGECQLF